MSHAGSTGSHVGSAEAEVRSERHERDQRVLRPIHSAYDTGEPLHEVLCQADRDDESQAMQEHGVHVEVVAATATDGKHMGGVPIA
eukprot:1346836-Pyramimonas_sp.AAC.1